MESNEHKAETYKSLITISTEGFKALQYLNGGAVIAILTYLGTLECVSPKIISLTKLPLYFFIAGLVAATLLYLTSYMNQYCLHNENNNRKSGFGEHQYWLYGSMFLVLVSLILFCSGAISAVDALLEIAKVDSSPG